MAGEKWTNERNLAEVLLKHCIKLQDRNPVPILTGMGQYKNLEFEEQLPVSGS